MASPIDPTACKNTGRLLTEWFEYPEFTDEEIKALARAKSGFNPDNKTPLVDMTPEEAEAFRKYTSFINSHKSKKWVNNMSQQEVAARMNEATKMIDPSNFKFLDDATRERTGLELNPLWMLECMVRSGILGPKEQIAALKELAQYTHSKAPNINHNTNITASEDWLLELSKADYKVVDENHSFQPKQPREAGMGRHYEKRKTERVALMNRAQDLINSEAEAMTEELGDYTFGDEEQT